MNYLKKTNTVAYVGKLRPSSTNLLTINALGEN